MDVFIKNDLYFSKVKSGVIFWIVQYLIFELFFLYGDRRVCEGDSYVNVYN